MSSDELLDSNHMKCVLINKVIINYSFPLKYSNGCGSYFSRSILWGLSASVVTIHGDMVVIRFLAVNGPRGMYSQA